MANLFDWLKSCFLGKRQAETEELSRARSLIKAINKGGIPLNPAKVNAIARDLGLEVSRSAPVEETIERIRAYLQRSKR